MSYQVLARKWRPKTFPEMVGQEHVLRALINALDNDRLHHAFLFTGTRGVGKTTVARILAKSINCEQGISSQPCGVCSACTDIDGGRFVDLIEVDAASRTKVEDTRELLENVQYAPSVGRYKVYLIDEVHMLSISSFNALLKTLEEPPPHVKFLLATTDPQKLPITILSRCLQFNLKSMSTENISSHLEMILQKEAVDFDPASLLLLARSAEGSMRDALSLMDQAISFGGGRLGEDDVRAMLGTIDSRYISSIIQALIDENAAELVKITADISLYSPDYLGILDEMQSMLYRIALAQVEPSAIDNTFGDKGEVLALAEKITPENAQLYYQIALVGRKDLQYAADIRIGFEMLLLRMLAFAPIKAKPAAKPLVAKATANTQNSPAPQSESNSGGKRLSGLEAVKAELNKNCPAQQDQKKKPAELRVESKPVSEKPQQQLLQKVLDDDRQPEDVYAEYAQAELVSGEVASEDAIPEKTISEEAAPNHSTAKTDTFTQVQQPLTSRSEPQQTEASPNERWKQAQSQLNLSGMAAQLALNCSADCFTAEKTVLIADKTVKNLISPIFTSKIEEKISEYFGCSVKVDIKAGEISSETPAMTESRKKDEFRKEAFAEIKNDNFVKDIENIFGAKIIPESIRLL